MGLWEEHGAPRGSRVGVEVVLVGFRLGEAVLRRGHARGRK
jgi:hypothetical protein